MLGAYYIAFGSVTTYNYRCFSCDFEILLFTTGPVTSGESSGSSCVSVCSCIHRSVCPIQMHISVTAERNFLILGMVMGYDLDIMPVI